MAAAKIGLSWVNHADLDGAVLTSSGAAGDTSESNLVNPIVGRRWRTTSLTGYAQVDLLADKTIEVLSLRFPRDTSLPLIGSVRWQLDADGGTAGTGAVYDQTVTLSIADGYGYHVHVPASAQTARYVRFTFSGVSNVTFIDVGRLWVGELWRPTFNIALGYDDQWRDLSRVSASEHSGAEYVDKRTTQRVFSFGLKALSQSERDEIREMQRLVGISGQVLFVKDPTSPAKETVLGRLAASTPIRHPNIPIYSKAFTVRESL